MYINIHKRNTNINKRMSINDLFFDELVKEDDSINTSRLQEIADDKDCNLAYFLLRHNTFCCGRKGTKISELMSNLVEPFVNPSFNRYLLPLLVLTSGNMISFHNYWSMKIKININMKSIGEIVRYGILEPEFL
jgi:hypothetical protein